MAGSQVVPRNYMANLHEYCQKRKLKLDYKDVSTTGPPHDPIFTVMVVIENRDYAPATGKSKKEARNCAAKLAWDAIHQEGEAHPAPAPLQQPRPQPSPYPSLPPPQSPQCAASSLDVTSSPSANYISLLNEYASKNKVSVQYPLKDKIGEDHKPNFFCACEIDGKIYGEGTGQTKQKARFNAAKQAYEKLMTQTTFRPEQSAASINKSLCNSQEPSGMVSMNGMDSDSKSKGINDKLATITGAVQESEVSLSTMKEQPSLPDMSFACSASPSSPDVTSAGSASKSSCSDGHSTAVVPDSSISSSLEASPRDPAVKPKRKDTLLAPTFSKLHQSKYTANKRFLKQFVDIEKIGHGGFGRVFKAKHAIDKRVCAVKRVKLSFEEKEKAEREVEVLATLQHENIVRYYGCWIGKDSIELEDSMSENSSLCDCLFIEMEFCEKGTLADWMKLKRGTKRCKDASLMKFQQIVEGVEYIHSKGLIHRDLKPLNILISKEDKIKIGDFGLVTTCVDDPSVQRTENRGTKIYMAPEQAGKSYGKEVDIFPLGLILFEMLYIFETDSERSREWANIKKLIFPQTFNEKFPAEAALIKAMLSEAPCKRPSPTKILEFFHHGELNGLHTC